MQKQAKKADALDEVTLSHPRKHTTGRQDADRGAEGRFQIHFPKEGKHGSQLNLSLNQESVQRE